MFWGWFVGVALATGLWMVPQGVQAAGEINVTSTPVSENFNSMGTSATASLPTGWKYSQNSLPTATTATWTNTLNVTATTQATNSGSPTTGARYNWGSTGGADRAPGIMGSGSFAGQNSIMAGFTNNTGNTITQILVTVSVERFRINTTAATNTFFFSTDGKAWGTYLYSNVMTTAASSYGYALSTNVVEFTVASQSIAAGGAFYLLFTLGNAGSNSQGWGIDDFSMTLQYAPSVSAPSVTTVAASATNTTTATVNGDVTADGGATVTERGVCYKTTAGVAITDNKTAAAAGGTGAFSVDLSSLSVNQIYYFKAYAENSAGTTLSTTELDFTTRAAVPSAPTVNNATVSTLDIAVNENGNPSSTEFAIQRTSDNQYLQTDGSWGASAVWATKDTWGTKTATGLASGTEYTFQVKARNSVNVETAFGATASGTTLDAIVFHAKVPGWADHNPGDPAIWGPFNSWASGYTMTVDGTWWVATVPVADQSAAITYQLRFSQAGSWKYQNKSGSSYSSENETYTTSSGHIWIDATSPDYWGSGGEANNFSLSAAKTTLVVLSLLTARDENGQVVIRWETSSEENTVGFFVERWDGSAWVRVNDQIVYANGQDGMGSSYALVDAGASVDEVYSYRLVEVETGGSEEVYGPYDLSTGFAFRQPVEFSENGAATIRWLSRQGETYTVLRSSDLTKGREGFQTLSSGIAATPPENTYIDNGAGSLGVYRITADGE